MWVVCMAPYSIDLRQKILQAYERGEGSQRRLAELFDVSISFVEKLFMQLRRTGHVEPKPHAGGTASRINAAGRLCLQQWLWQQPDLTLAELAARLDDALGIHVSMSSVCRALQELGLPRKKSRSMPRSAIASP
jgi:transposase